MISTSLLLQTFFFMYICVFFSFWFVLFSFCRNCLVKTTMDPFNELTNELALLNQQIRMRKMANEYHQRVTNQVRNPHMHMA